MNTAAETHPPSRSEDRGRSSTDKMLEADDLRVRYDQGAIGLQGVTISVPTGAITALVGANGAGKSTLLRAISGFLRSDRVRLDGVVRIQGKDITRLAPHSIARRGVALVAERDKVFRTMSVADNLRAVPTLRGTRAQRAQTEATVYDLFPVLAERRSQVAGLLSGGEKQMLGIARSLMLQPKLLLADELSMGIAPALVPVLMEKLRSIRRELGTTVLLVEQNVDAAMKVADYVYVLESGLIAAEGTPGDLEGRADLQEAYFGGAVR